jgi:hypothetical protein
MDPETRAKISAALRGRVQSPEERAKRSQIAKASGRRPPDATGRVQSEQERASHSAALKGRAKSEETKGRMKAAALTRAQTPEARRRLVDRMNGPESRKKAAAARTGQALPVETRAKISEGLRASPRVAARKEVRGPDHYAWKGGSYTTAHREAGRSLPHVCLGCGKTDGKLDCALKHDAPAENVRVDPRHVTATKTGLYSIRPRQDYMRLCQPCHRIYDRLNPRKSGPTNP